MLDQFRTLRFKLTMLYVLIFGLIQALLWVTVDVVRTQYMREQFDADLVTKTRVVADALTAAAAAAPEPIDAATVAAILRPFISPDLRVQVRTRDGRSLGHSRWLDGDLPFEASSLASGAAETPVLSTLSGATAKQVAGEIGPLRLVTMYQQPAGDIPFYVQAVSSTAGMEKTASEIHSLLFTVCFVSLVIAGVTSWLMARRALTPVAEIVRQARRLDASRLDHRIPVPQGNDEIVEMVRVINEMLDRLAGEFANQQRFISSVSHELKTPLAVLLGEAQAIRRHGSDAATFDEFVAMVQQEAGRLVRIVDAFLILTRAASGAGPAVQVQTAVEDIVFEAVKRARPKAEEFGVRVVPTLDFPEDEPEPVIAGDVDLLCSMVENLVRNAIRYTAEGCDVDVLVTTAGGRALITVRDCGPGIPPDQIDRVFELFQQTSPDNRRAGKLGIGLSIAQSVAKLHGGAIRAANRPEGGCEFVVEIPLAAGVEEPVQAA